MLNSFAKNVPFNIKVLSILCGLITLSACGGSDSNSDTTTTLPPVVSPPITSPNDDVCKAQTTEVNWTALMTQDCSALSDYGLFVEPSNPTHQPRSPGVFYQLSTELFSNYASKYRFLFLPQGTVIDYQAKGVMTLPVGAVLVKTFALPYDTQNNGAENELLVETRLLIHRETGWTALAYQWQNQQANLIIAGTNVSHTMNNQGEALTFDYHIPSKAECKICHQVAISDSNQSSKIMPIGLKAHVLNRNITANDNQQNQLSVWQQQGMLNGLPELSSIPKSFAINDDSADLTARAKGYLDINCAHCHNPQGFASISGLRLSFDVDHTGFEYGICKQPPGWDGGPNGLAYDIVPGNAERSIVHYRQVLSSAKDRMPPIGREIIHQEGTALIKQWIDSLSPTLGSCE